MVKCCFLSYVRLQIENFGDCYFCCPSIEKFKVGNIFTDSVEEIWYGKRATEFRKSIIDGSYKYCDLQICSEKNSYEVSEKDFLHPPYPEYVDLSYLKLCNLRCVTCRDELLMDETFYKNYDLVISKILQLCKNAKIVLLNGLGELFVSQHYKNLCNLIVKNYPNIKFKILTNGILCDEKHLKDFGIINNLDSVFVSVHAAKKKTYESIVRGAKFEILNKNLKYLSSLKTENKIKNFCMSFVVHSLNYKEMPAFVKMAEKYNAVAKFWRFRYWGDFSQMNKNYSEYTCWEKDHKNFKSFIKVLYKMKKLKGYAFDDAMLYKLQSEAKEPLFSRLINFFKF